MPTTRPIRNHARHHRPRSHSRSEGGRRGRGARAGTRHPTWRRLRRISGLPLARPMPAHELRAWRRRGMPTGKSSSSSPGRASQRARLRGVRSDERPVCRSGNAPSPDEFPGSVHDERPLSRWVHQSDRRRVVEPSRSPRCRCEWFSCAVKRSNLRRFDCLGAIHAHSTFEHRRTPLCSRRAR